MMTLTPALRRQRQADLCEFGASLVYLVSCRSFRVVDIRQPLVPATAGRKMKTELLHLARNTGTVSQTTEMRKGVDGRNSSLDAPLGMEQADGDT